MVPNGLGPGIFTTPPCQEPHRANKHFQWEKPLIRRAASDVQTLDSATLTPAFPFPVSLHLNKPLFIYLSIYFSACIANTEILARNKRPLRPMAVYLTGGTGLSKPPPLPAHRNPAEVWTQTVQQNRGAQRSTRLSGCSCALKGTKMALSGAPRRRRRRGAEQGRRAEGRRAGTPPPPPT